MSHAFASFISSQGNIDGQASCSVLHKTGFLALVYCQISTDLDTILHTPIFVWNTLVGRFRLRSAGGRLQAKPKRLCFFLILVTHRKSYRDDGSPRFRRQTVRVEVRTGAIVEKFRNFVAWVEPDKKQHFSRFYGTLPVSCAQPTGNSFTPNQWYH